MKKGIILTTSVLALLFVGFFPLNSAKADDPGCVPGRAYSVITGRPCTMTGTTASSYAWSRELVFGSRGEDVRYLQTLLQNRGYSLGRADGIYGRLTQSAVLNYQRSAGLNATGYADFNTLNSISSSTPTPVPCTTCGSGPSIFSISGAQTLNTNQSGTWTISATGTGTLTYSVNWGDQPSYIYGSTAPLSFSQQNATFTHTYFQSGSYNPTFKVTDSSGRSAEASLQVIVSEPFPIPSGSLFISTLNLPNAMVGASYNASISASGGSGSYSWGITSGSLPPGLTLSSAVCITFPCQAPATISGTPMASGTYNFTVYLSTPTGSTSRNFTLTVNPSVNAGMPTINSLSPTWGPAGTAVTIFGSNLSGVTEVRFGGIYVAPSIISTSQLSFIVPHNMNNCPPGLFCTMVFVPITPGSYSVNVVSSNGTSNTLSFFATN